MVTSCFGFLCRFKNSFHCVRSGVVSSGKVQFLQRYRIKAFLQHHIRYVINSRRVNRLDHRFLLHVAEQGQLSSYIVRKFMFCTAHQNICSNPAFHEGFHAVLGGFCFQVLRQPKDKEQSKVNHQCIVISQFPF